VKLRISPELQLPALEAQTQTIVVYGGKGMGKTNFGAVLAEELAANALRFSWFDPVGVAWGLKHSADGKREGVELLILGGAHGDIPINPNAGAVVADLVVDEEVSVLLDVSRHSNGQLWTGGEKIRFARDYFLRLYQRQGERKRPLMQIVDEAGRVVPQDIPGKQVDIMECVGAIEQLVELGRNAGVGVTLITQRSARMRKSVSELAEMMLAFRTVGPRSLTAIEDWFEEHMERKHALELRNRIRELPRGTAMIVSPGWLQIEGEYAIRARETFDSSETPVAGKERRPSGKGARVDRAKYEARMAETIEQAKADDPRELKRRIAGLERELAKQPSRSEFEVDRVVEKVVEVLVEVPAISDEQIEELREIATAMRDLSRGLAARADQIEEALRHVREAPARPRAEQRRTESARAPGPTRASVAPARRPAPPAVAPNIDEPLGKGERKVLDVLAEFPEGRTQKEVAFLAGYSANASTIGVILSKLRRLGLVEQGQPIRPTSEGLAVVGGPVEKPTGQALLDNWLRHPRMGEGERRVLLALIDLYPDLPTNEELAEITGYSPTASTLGVILSKLRKLGLVEKGRRGVAAELMEAINA